MTSRDVVGTQGADNWHTVVVDERHRLAADRVDLPMVDTLLLLRPKQSPVLFQQQIGRGLRLAPGKDSCLVLDFVGQHRAEFRFGRLLSSLTGLSHGELVDRVGNGFGSLPPGCHSHLQRQTSEHVLQSQRGPQQACTEPCARA